MYPTTSRAWHFQVGDHQIDFHVLQQRDSGLHAIGRMNGLGNYVKTRDAFLRIPRLSYSEWLEQNPEK